MNSFWILLTCGLACAHAQPNCDPNLLQKCFGDFPKNFNRGANFFPSTPAELEEICGLLIPMLECKVNLVTKCPDILSQWDKDSIHKTNHVVIKICNKGDFQTKYLRNAKCLSKVFVTEQKVCKEKAADKIDLGPCQHFKAIQNCRSTFIRNGCGSEASEMYEEYFMPLYDNGACDREH